MYTIIGGNPFTMYTGTTTFTGLSVISTVNSYEEAVICMKENYDKCAGLMMMLYKDKELEFDEDGNYIRPSN